jgi:hypothetical protein
MDLNSLIPDKFRPLVNPNWVIKGKFLMFKKYENIPICFIEDDIVYIFLDAKISKQVILLTKHIVDQNIEFYFTSPALSNPKGVDEDDYKDLIIRHYLLSFVNKLFYNGFKNIDFDLIRNMVLWCEKEDCYELIKDNYDDILKDVSRKHYDYYANKEFYDYEIDIREDFQTLYREIQINKIL